MVKTEIKVPIYGWRITYCYISGPKDAEEIKTIASKFGLQDVDELYSMAKKDAYDGGRTYCREGTREMVVIIFPCTCKEAFVNVFNHEKRHIVDNIIKWHEITDKESSAYLDGYISTVTMDFYHEIYNRRKRCLSKRTDDAGVTPPTTD